MVERCQRIAAAAWFQNSILGVIILSTLLVGLETVPGALDRMGPFLIYGEFIVLVIFTVELAIRIAAYGRRPVDFFKGGWNVFDFVIVALCYLPPTHYVAVLRIARVIRVLRLMSTVIESNAIKAKNRELAAAYAALEEEKHKSERLLLNILPELVAQRLKNEVRIIADSFPAATVLFADIAGFTRFSQGIRPEELVDILDDIFTRFDRLAEAHRVEKIKTIGDAYMAVAGVPEPRSDHAAAIADMALEMMEAMAAFNRERKLSLDIRIGIHSGPVIAGVIGRKRFIYDLWGDTVNTAARMESHSEPGYIQVTDDTRRLLGETFDLEPRGVLTVKDKGIMTTWFLRGKRPCKPA
jgi:class 3 adenylate cyclase